MTLKAPPPTSTSEAESWDNEDQGDDEESWEDEEADQPRVIYPEEISEPPPARNPNFASEEPAHPSHSNDDEEWEEEGNEGPVPVQPYTVQDTEGDGEEWEEGTSQEGDENLPQPGAQQVYYVDEEGEGEEYEDEQEDQQPQRLSQSQQYEQNRARPVEPLEPAQQPQVEEEYDDDEEGWEEEGSDGWEEGHQQQQQYEQERGRPVDPLPPTPQPEEFDEEEGSWEESDEEFDKMVESVLEENENDDLEAVKQSFVESNNVQRPPPPQRAGSDSNMGWSTEADEEDPVPPTPADGPRQESRVSTFSPEQPPAAAKAHSMANVYLGAGACFLLLGLACAIVAIVMRDEGRT